MESGSTGSSKVSKKKRKEILRRIAEEIRGGRSFLISTHQNPEGDAIGSVLALGLALKGLGKDVLILTQDPVPEVLAFLPGAGEIIHRAPLDRRFDLALAVDCGDRPRLGEEFNKVQGIGKIINIDHHVSNGFYGDLNLVDPGASSAAEIIYDLIRILAASFTREVAENIYTGLMTDTGSFHYSNTSPKTFSVARACLLAGVDPWEVSQRVYDTQPLPRLRLLPRVLDTLELSEDGRVGAMVVTQDMLKEAGATVAMTEDFINFPRSVRGVEVALLFREVTPQKYRVSMRSRGAVDVARIAGKFQGGGHPAASGCTVEGSLSQVQRRVLGVVREAL
ncbi:MAG: bifunctional oligoribonuclease/PAP phosphatase NrnA [Syntrophaceae bacterium]|nr:bifunctional oligoribonuclease/PAP phosphatase NrnA [Syntrophaceae bacterium]